MTFTKLEFMRFLREGTGKGLTLKKTAYILDEERDLPITFSQKLQKLGIISKIKSIFKKK